jgi:ERCC4-type nuclease
MKKTFDKLSKSSVVGVVLVECTPSSQPFFGDLQTLLVFDYSLKVVPVESVEEAAHMIVQLAKKSQSSNPFVSTKPLPPPDPLVLQTVQMLPRTGSTNAKNLLNKFGSIQGIACATEQELSEVTGKANAHALSKFLS